MDLAELQSVQSRERDSDDLQELRESFYEDVGAYIAALKEQRDQLAAEADDPFGSEEISQITDEIETAQEVVRAVYERRVGKVIEQAALAAAGYRVEPTGMTHEEERLFERVAETIESNKATVLDVIEGENVDGVTPTDTASSEPEPDTTPARKADPKADVQPDTGQPAVTNGAGAAVEPDHHSDPPPDQPPDHHSDHHSDQSAGPQRTTVRINDDIGEILGVDDHTYDLAADDVVRLPEANATPLLDRDAADRLE